MKTYTYSRDSGDFHATNIRRGQGTIVFDMVTPWRTVTDIELGVPVEINIENAIAAMAACMLTGDVSDRDMRLAIGSFLGAERRFQFLIKEQDRAIIDDYAHHPDEIKMSIKSVRAIPRQKNHRGFPASPVRAPRFRPAVCRGPFSG